MGKRKPRPRNTKMTQKQKTGVYTRRNNTYRRNNRKKRSWFKRLAQKQKTGIFLIVFSALLWFFRPFQDIHWWQFGQQAASWVVLPIITLIAGVALIVGLFKLFGGRKR